MSETIKEGNYEKPGVHVEDGTVIFTFEGEKEDNCAILFYNEEKQLIRRVAAPAEYCMGSMRSVAVEGINPEKLLYNYEINGTVMQDVYATRIIGREKWNDTNRIEDNYATYCGYESPDFSWQGDCQPEIPRHEMVMYKLHVRGFSMNASTGHRAKGTFETVRNQISYLKKLGITTIEFMPVYEFEEMTFSQKIEVPSYITWESKKNDLIQKGQMTYSEKVNYWGYVPGSYFAVKASYGGGIKAGAEWKSLIRELHANGMECVMEMFFDEHMNQNVILDALHFWVREYHVDGFHLLGNAVPITAIIQDARLSRTKIFYTGFDSSLLESEKGYPHLFTYNDEYLYPARKLLNHLGGDMQDFACQQRKQHKAQGFVNYIAGNNGFTLWDLFSYGEKHNEANGENNCDGNNWNFSSNCGVEGKTTKRYVCTLREKQLRNAIAILMMAQGVPLLLAGDEIGNSQNGNNNAYCQDNEVGWINWKKAEKFKWFTEYVEQMIIFRKNHPVLSMDTPMQLSDYMRVGYPDLSYHGENAWISSFYRDNQAVGMMYCGEYAQLPDGTKDDYIYVGYNFHNGSVDLALPKLPENRHWYLCMDTAEGRNAFSVEETLQVEPQISMKGQSVVILIGK